VSAGRTAGGRFEFDPDTVTARLAEWNGIRQDLVADQDYAKALLATRSCGDEPASLTMANLVRRSGEEFLRHNAAMVEFVDGHIDALTAARDTYVNGEEAAVAAMRRSVRWPVR
jgi:hypothetical protein